MAEQIIEFQGQRHVFPAEATEAQIAAALASMTAPQQPAAPAGPPVPAWERIAQGGGDVVRGVGQFLANVLPPAAIAGGSLLYNVARPGGIENLPESVSRAVQTGAGAAQSVNEEIAARDREYKGRLAAAGQDEGIDWWRMGGNMLAGGLLGGPLTSVPRTAIGSVVQGAAVGGGMGAMAPVTDASRPYAEQAMGNAAMGAGLGGALGGAFYGVGRALAPQIDPNVARLRQAGVDVTPGQALGGTARGLEDAAANLPIIGPAVRSAQRHGIETLNRTVANRALSAIGERVDDAIPVGNDLVHHVGNRISNAYEVALRGASARLQLDRPFLNNVFSVRGILTKREARDEFQRIISVTLGDLPKNQPFDARAFQQLRTDLTQRASTFYGDDSALSQQLARALDVVIDSLDDLAVRQMPAVANQLRAANSAWSQYKRMLGAAQSVGAVNGVFTAQQFANAVRRLDRSPGHSRYATGRAPMQDLSNPALAVLPASMPDSGTAPRMSNIALLSGLLGMNFSSLGIPGQAVLGGLGALGAYTPSAQKAIQAFLTGQRPAMVRRAGETIARSGGIVANPVAEEIR